MHPVKERSAAKPRMNHVNYAMMFAKLTEETASTSTLVDMTGLTEYTVTEFMRTLRRLKVVHICSWEPGASGRMTDPVWILGPGRDAAKPKRKSSAQRTKQWRERKKMRETLNVTAGVPIEPRSK